MCFSYDLMFHPVGLHLRTPHLAHHHIIAVIWARYRSNFLLPIEVSKTKNGVEEFITGATQKKNGLNFPYTGWF